MKDIPVHQMHERVSTGLEMRHFFPDDVLDDRAETLGAHRDDHYIFFLMEAGVASLMIDFHELQLEPSSLYYILPGQVHHRLRTQQTQGWFVAVDTGLIPRDYREVFENQLILQQPYPLDERLLRQCRSLLHLMEEKYMEGDRDVFNLPVTHSLLKSFLGIVASGFSCLNSRQTTISRPAQLSHQFKKLVQENVRILKSPSAYAAKLHVSESYLNEALKKVTGFSVSYWVQHEVVLEAKRLLYYSQLNVKEIAHKLGYEDHAYFSRMFKKATNITPLAFRGNYRK